MKVSRLVVLQFNDDLTEATRVVDVSYEYDGPIALAKKGRGAQGQNTSFEQQQAQQYGNYANTGFNAANNFYQNELSGAPGQMNSPSAAQYASDLNNINSVYNGLRQNAFATAGERGYGNAPSGFQRSAINSLNQGQANAQTNAYNTGIVNTYNQRASAAAGEAGLYGQSASAELGNTNSANQSAFMQSQMGSTLGDVVGGVSSILGGISGIGNFVNQWRNFGSGGGTGLSFMPGDLAGAPTGNLPLSPLSKTFNPSAIGNY